MNFYIRYFDTETLVYTPDEVFSFLESLSDFPVTEHLKKEILGYIQDDASYPKRYKVRPRTYFIIIKTTVASLEEFKANNKSNQFSNGAGSGSGAQNGKLAALSVEKIGWYVSFMGFKRVVPIEGTNKHQYIDAYVELLVEADSPMQCYEETIKYLHSRDDIDSRSQFPSCKNQNFQYYYIGETKPEIS